MKRLKRLIPLTLVLLLVGAMIGPAVSLAYDSSINLGTAENFAVLAGSTITNTGTTVIDGDVGLHPGTEFTGQGTATINGEVHINDAVAITAKTDLEAAYNDAAGRTTNTIASELGGSTLTSGVYSSETSFQITGTLTLDGENDPNSVFIFQAGSTLTTATDSSIVLINGASYENIFWQVGSSATLGTNSIFAGNILALTSITANTGAGIQGSLLALNGAVTLDNNTITQFLAAIGSLTVTKVVSGDTTDLTLPTFEITVTGPEDFTETRTFTDTESYTWEDLVPGEYTVTESRTGLSDEWTVSGEGVVVVSAGNNETATITNTYTKASESTPTTGSLTVSKVVIGDIDDLTLPTFDITVTGPEGIIETRDFANGESYTWEDLVPGEYTVTENRTDLSDEWTVEGEGAVQVSADGNHTATITNTYTEASESTPVEPEPTEPEPTEPEPTEPEPINYPDEEMETIPQTGQVSNYGLITILIIASAIFGGTGTILAIRRKKLNE